MMIWRTRGSIQIWARSCPLSLHDGLVLLYSSAEAAPESDRNVSSGCPQASEPHMHSRYGLARQQTLVIEQFWVCIVHISI